MTMNKVNTRSEAATDFDRLMDRYDALSGLYNRLETLYKRLKLISDRQNLVIERLTFSADKQGSVISGLFETCGVYSKLAEDYCGDVDALCKAFVDFIAGVKEAVELLAADADGKEQGSNPQLDNA